MAKQNNPNQPAAPAPEPQPVTPAAPAPAAASAPAAPSRPVRTSGDPNRGPRGERPPWATPSPIRPSNPHPVVLPGFRPGSGGGSVIVPPGGNGQGGGGLNPGQGGTTPGGGAIPPGGGVIPGGDTTPGQGGGSISGGSSSGGSSSNSGGSGAGGAGGAGAGGANGDQPLTTDLLQQLWDTANKKFSNKVDYDVDKAVQDLLRAQEDSQGGYNSQLNRINSDEAQARDRQVLYAHARGDRGGITAHQYDSISNAAALQRSAVEGQRQKLATDTARKVADLRAQGEFQKADALLANTQKQLQMMWEQQKHDEQMALQEAQLTGKYKGQETLSSKQASAQLALEYIQAGMAPPPEILGSAGIDSSRAQQLATLAALKKAGVEGAQIDALMQQMFPDLFPQYPAGGYGGGGGGGVGRQPSVEFDMGTDYQALIDEAIKNRDYAAAEHYTAQRNAKLEAMSQIDTTRNYQAEIDAAIAAGDFQLAAQLDAMRNGKIEAGKLEQSLTGGNQQYYGPGGPEPEQKPTKFDDRNFEEYMRNLERFARQGHGNFQNMVDEIDTQSQSGRFTPEQEDRLSELIDRYNPQKGY